MFQMEGKAYVNGGGQIEPGTFKEEKEAQYCWRIILARDGDRGESRGHVTLCLLSPLGRLNFILRVKKNI